MEGTGKVQAQEVRQLARARYAHWRGAAVVMALAAADVAYRRLVRQQVRRALGIEVRRA